MLAIHIQLDLPRKTLVFSILISGLFNYKRVTISSSMVFLWVIDWKRFQLLQIKEQLSPELMNH